MTSGGPIDIAIVGMGYRSPAAPDVFRYWENVLAGRTAPDSDATSAVEAGPLAVAIAAARADAGIGDDGWVFVGNGALDRAAEALATGEAGIAVAGEQGDERGGPHAAAVVLRRRADAERAGDRIYAVLKDRGDADGPVPASGIPGVIQAALAVFHRVRPTDLHPARPWIQADASRPRRARVADLAVLEEHPSADERSAGALVRWETEAILLSAPDRDGLADRIRGLSAWLDDHPDAELKDIAYTLNTADDHDDADARLGVVASSTADLSARLAAVLPRLDDPSPRPIGDGRGLYHADEPLGAAGGLAFLFPGEGSQYPGMLADLCIHFPEVRRQFDTADRIAMEQGDAVRPSEQLFGGNDGGAALWSAPTAVNLILNAQWALYQVLEHLGLRPDAVAGHSSGEILALAAAGVLWADREMEHQLGRLGSIFRALETTGDLPAARLVAVAADRPRAEAACRESGADEVVVAIDNCPHQVVLAGPPEAIDRVVANLRAGGVLVEILPFDRAYHTPEFAAVLGPIADSFAGMTFRAPRLPVYSCATRERMPDDPEAIRSLAIAQWTRAVEFRETVEAMYADGLRIFVDVGARGNLAGFVQDILRGRPALAVAANLPRRGGLTQLNHLVAALFAHGVPIRPAFLYARRRPRRIDAIVRHPAKAVAIRSILAVGYGGASDESDRVTIDPIETSLHPRRLSEPDPIPLAPRFRFDADEPEPLTATNTDATMLLFQETMRTFLETQQAVLSAYLGSAPGTPTADVEPGPWVGEVRRFVPGSEVESVHVLDVRRDPIAEHHTLGGRKVSALDPTLRGLPVLPFAVMAEMAAQAAAMLVDQGLVLSRLVDVNAHKWVRYEEEPVVVELHGRREPSPEPGEQRVRVSLFNRGPGGRSDAPRPVFGAVAVFAASTPGPPPASPWSPEDARPSRFTADSIYDEQWLFHGPAMQAVSEVGVISAVGIDGALRVLPWEPLVEPGRSAGLHSDVIVIDSFTHLLGCWGLDELADRGDVVFPLRMGSLQVFGDRPEVGTDVACRIAVEQLERHRLRVRAEIARPDGTIWMLIDDWEDWRFHWPGRYRDVFRQPRDHFVGEELPTGDRTTRAVWLAPPADMGRPVWRDVLEHTQLGPVERAAHLAMGGPEDIRSRRLWGRIAAKEAARRLWRDEGRAPIYPADLAVVEEEGRSRLIRLDDPDDRSLPSIAIADADGVAVAIASADPDARPGIAVARIGAEDPSRSERSARIQCAREAACRSIGMTIADDPDAVEVVRVDEHSGRLHVRLAALPGKLVPVASARRGESVWAWTFGEGVDP